MQTLVKKAEQSIGVKAHRLEWLILSLKLGLWLSRAIEKRGLVVGSRNEKKPRTDSTRGPEGQHLDGIVILLGSCRGGYYLVPYLLFLLESAYKINYLC